MSFEQLEHRHRRDPAHAVDGRDLGRAGGINCHFELGLPMALGPFQHLTAQGRQLLDDRLHVLAGENYDDQSV